MNVRDSHVHNYPPRWNAAPSQDLLVIRRNHETGGCRSTRCAGASFPIGARTAGAGRSTPNARRCMPCQCSGMASPGSIQKPAPPPAGSSPQQKQPSNRCVGLRCKHPRPPIPNQGSERVSSESDRVLLRHTAGICRRSVAILRRRVHPGTAGYLGRWASSREPKPRQSTPSLCSDLIYDRNNRARLG
jgi:hypothetical protein